MEVLNCPIWGLGKMQKVSGDNTLQRFLDSHLQWPPFWNFHRVFKVTNNKDSVKHMHMAEDCLLQSPVPCLRYIISVSECKIPNIQWCSIMQWEDPFLWPQSHVQTVKKNIQQEMLAPGRQPCMVISENALLNFAGHPATSRTLSFG